MKIHSLVTFFLLSFITSFGQSYDTTQYYGKMQYIFHNVDRSQISSGYLRDYGIEFLDLENYTGAAAHDSNYVSMEEWRLLYASLYSSRINGNASMLYLDTINRLVNKYNYSDMPITFVGLHFNYNKLKDNVISSNLMTVSNDQLFDVPGRPTSPYESNSLFAMAPIRQAAVTGDNQFIFRPELFISNTGKTISSVAYKPAGSSTYQAVAFNTPFTIHYDTTGFFDIDLRIIYTDLSTVYGHTKVAVYKNPNNPSAKYGNRWGNQDITASRAYLGQTAVADITVELAVGNGTTQIRKPLIVVEGFDPDNSYHYVSQGGLIDGLNFDANTGLEINFNSELDDTREYDMIFVNWKNGTDYIQRNAYALQEVIDWVNDRKTTWNGVRQGNVIIGMSMGGLIARYALRDMELNSIDHETRLFISHDAPHWGANVPVGAQAAVQHLAPWQIVNFGGTFPGIQINWIDMFPAAVTGVDMLNSPAARQMLIQRYTLSGETLTAENSMHTAFTSELNTMGWPLNCKNVTLANGSCDGTKIFADNSTLLSIDGARAMTYMGAMWRSFAMTTIGALPPLNNFITGPGNPSFNGWAMVWQFPLSLFATRSSIGVDFKVRAIPSSGTQEIYRGDIYSRKKIAWLIDVKSYLMKCRVNSNSGMLALDNAPGGVYDIEKFGFDPSEIQSQLPPFFQNYIQTSVLQPRFCFVPTVSALALSNPTTHFLSSICTSVDCLSPAAVETSYAPSQNQLHISNTQANSDWILQMQNPLTSCAKICTDGWSISGDNSFCTTSGTYSLPTLPSGASVVWTASPSINVFINSPTSASTTLTRFGVGGRITLTATISNSCGKSVAISYPNIQVGTANDQITVTRFMGTQCVGSSNPPTPFVVSNPGGVSMSSVEIEVYSGGSVYNASNTSTPVTTATTPMFYLKASSYMGSMMIRVRILGTCGWSDWKYITISGCTSGLRVAMAPNPSSNDVHVTLMEGNEKKMISEIMIMDKRGATRKHVRLNKSEGRINIADLPADTYIIRVFDGRSWISEKIIKQ